MNILHELIGRRTIGAEGFRILPSSPLIEDIPQEVVEFANTGIHSSSSFNEGLKPRAVELPRYLCGLSKSESLHGLTQSAESWRLGVFSIRE